MTNYLLLLHGYTQNSTKFYKTITKLLSKTFLNKFIVINPNGCYIVDMKEEKYGWWKLPSPEKFSLPHQYVNFNKAVNYIQDLLPKFKSDDTLNIISFSQGTILAEYMLVHNLFTINPQKVIMFSPSGIMDKKHKKLKTIVNSSVLVMIGEKEGVFGLSIKNYNKVSCIGNYEAHLHSQGHVVPLKSEYKHIIRKFLVRTTKKN